MMLERADGGAVDLDTLKQRLEATFLVTMRGGAENDGYNALVLAAGLMWRDVALIRAISRYLRQIRVPVFAGLHVGDAAQARQPSPPRSCSCFTCASIRGSTP